MMMKRKQIGGRNNDDDDDGSCPERIRYDSPIISFSRILGEVGIISWARGRHPESLADVVVAWLSSTVDKSQRRIWRKSWAPLQTSLLPPLVSPYLSRQLFFHVFLLFLSYSSVHISEEPSLCLYPVSFLSIAGQRERGEGGVEGVRRARGVVLSLLWRRSWEYRWICMRSSGSYLPS